MRNYAVVPSSLLPQMPATPACRWLTYEEVEAAGMRVDAMVADLGPDLTEAPGLGAGRRGDRRRAGARPALHRRDPDRPHAARRADAQRIRRAAAVAPVPGDPARARAAADRGGPADPAADHRRGGAAGAARQLGADLLPAEPGRPARPRVPHGQVPHHAPQRRRAELHPAPTTSASRGSATCCAASGSTRCRSW